MNFKRYVEASDTWLDSHYIMGTSTDTLTTLPAVLYPNAVTATVGLKGNMEQTSQPSPTTPIQPQETGERTGNLFDYSAITTGYRIQWTTGNDYPDDTAVRSDYIPVSSGTYSCSDSVIVLGYDASKNYIGATNGDGVFEKMAKLPITQFTILANSDCNYIKILSFYNVQTPMNIDAETILNSGSTPLPYEPWGIKIPISSASTTTPVYLGEVQSVRAIKKKVFDGTENFTKNAPSNPNNFLYYQTGYGGNKTCICTHLEDMGTLSTGKIGIFNANSVLYFNFGADVMNAQPSGNTVAGLKEYLAAQYVAGTPVTVWYVLATEQTGIVNEPIRKIGDYADEVSGITIPTIAGANSLDVLTTLKPSEVTVNYKGWHPVADVHERDNGQWD